MLPNVTMATSTIILMSINILLLLLLLLLVTFLHNNLYIPFQAENLRSSPQWVHLLCWTGFPHIFPAIWCVVDCYYSCVISCDLQNIRWMLTAILTKRLELLFLTVFALPNASSSGLDSSMISLTCCKQRYNGDILLSSTKLMISL